MGSYLIGILISLIVGIILAVIIFKLTGEKKNTLATEPDEKADHSEHAPDKHSEEHGHSEHSSSSEKSVTLQKMLGATGILIVWIVVIVLGIWIGAKIIKNVSNSKKTTQTESVKHQYHWVIDESKTRTIGFTCEYGDVFRYIHPGDNVSFENATTSYCILNRIREYCSQGVEDVGPQMPNSINNCELRFKSQNGKAGTIRIVFWVWTKY